MGRNRNRMRVDDMIRQGWNTSNQQNNAFLGQVNSEIDPAQERAQKAWDAIFSGATGLMNRERFSPERVSWDPNRVRSLDEDIAGFKEIGRTGGWSDEDKALARGRADRTPRSLFEGLARRSTQQRAIQGNYAPGAATESRALGREAARASTEALADADIGINESVRQGKLAGLAGAGELGMALGSSLVDTDKFNSQMGLNAAQFNNQQDAQGLEALLGLYGTAPAEVQMYLDRSLAGMGQGNDARMGWTGQQGEEDQRRWGRFGAVAGGLSGLASSLATGGMGGGLGSLGSSLGRKPRSGGISSLPGRSLPELRG